ncbi:MAG: copper amine oxidase N-terminal domain-containing protein [Eubacteriales bacterium]
MKKIIVLILFCLFIYSIPVSAQNDISVTINGKNVVFTDAVPFINENDRTLVPLRAIGEAMGLSVNWVEDENMAIFSKIYTWESSPELLDSDGDGTNDTYLGNESVKFIIGEKKAIHDVEWYNKDDVPGEDYPTSGGFDEITMDTAAVIKNSRTFAPVRYLAEAFRYNVGWDDATSTVNLNYLYSIYELGIQTDNIAFWEDSQGWMFTINDKSNIESLDIQNIVVNDLDKEFRILTKDEQATIYEMDETYDKYLNGFIIYNDLEIDTNYECVVMFSVTYKDGSQKLGLLYISYLYDGSQGGYI